MPPKLRDREIPREELEIDPKRSLRLEPDTTGTGRATKKQRTGGGTQLCEVEEQDDRTLEQRRADSSKAIQTLRRGLSSYPIRHSVFSNLSAFEVAKLLFVFESCGISLQALQTDEGEIEMALNPLRDIFYPDELEAIDKVMAEGVSVSIFGNGVYDLFDRRSYKDVDKLSSSNAKGTISLFMIVLSPKGDAMHGLRGWEWIASPRLGPSPRLKNCNERKTSCPDSSIDIRNVGYGKTHSEASIWIGDYEDDSMFAMTKDNMILKDHRHSPLPYINVNCSPFELHHATMTRLFHDSGKPNRHRLYIDTYGYREDSEGRRSFTRRGHYWAKPVFELEVGECCTDPVCLKEGLKKKNKVQPRERRCCFCRGHSVNLEDALKQLFIDNEPIGFAPVPSTVPDWTGL